MVNFGVVLATLALAGVSGLRKMKKMETQNGCEAGWTPASWTWYNSYAACCPENPNYDPNADNSECELYNACQWSGYFAYVDGQKPYSWVANTDIIAFFSSYGDNAAYGNKRLRMKVNTTVIEAEVLDTCGDSDCNGCCTRNSQPSGYLLDMEENTVVRYFGYLNAAYGQICWQIADGSPTPTSAPSPVPTPVGSGGCCTWGGTGCDDCGTDGTGWCHGSASNCEASCDGTFDPNGEAPACNGEPPAPPPSSGSCCWGGCSGTCSPSTDWCAASQSNCEGQCGGEWCI